VIELDNSSWPMKEARPVCEALKLPLPRNARLSLLYGSLVSVRQGGMREDLLPSGMSAWDDDIERGLHEYDQGILGRAQLHDSTDRG
jgi:hypothetical protein